MIWWPLIKEYSFEPELNKKIELTKGLFIEYSNYKPGIRLPRYKFQVWVGESHNCMDFTLPHPLETRLHFLTIIRNKKLITLKINGEKRTFYLKTPPIWKLK